MYDSAFQFPPISSNFAQRSGTTFHRPQSTAWSTLCEGDVALYEANGGHTRYGLVFWSTPLPYIKYLWWTDTYLYSQSCEVHRLGPNEFLSIDWCPYMNCNSVKSMKLLHVEFIFLLSIYREGHYKWCMCCQWFIHIWECRSLWDIVNTDASHGRLWDSQNGFLRIPQHTLA